MDEKEKVYVGILNGKIILDDKMAGDKMKTFILIYDRPVLLRELLQQIHNPEMPTVEVRAFEESQ